MNCEVTKLNFERLLPNIKQNLRSADFIVIDATCSLHPQRNQLMYRSFLTAEEQFYAIKQNINKCRIIQLNLTTFNFIKRENKYFACTHIFYIYKRYIQESESMIGLFAVPALRSLNDNNFDMNKFVKDGITYLNIAEEEKLRKDLAWYSVQSPYSSTFHSDSMLGFRTKEQEEAFEGVCVTLYTWLKQNNEEKSLVLNDSDYDDKLLRYLVIKQINVRFCTLWASYTGDGKIVVNKVSDFERNKHETMVEKESSYEIEFLTSCIGFSCIFKFLTTLRIPLVGHDLFSHLVAMYDQFHGPLPDTYEEFKVNINSMFLNIYDTKFISNELQEKCSNGDVWESNELGDLYQYFKESSSIPNIPTIKLVPAFHEDVSNMNIFHERTGLNVSFQVGYCFINMMHLITMESKSSHEDSKPVTSKNHLFAVQKYKQRIYACIANISYVNLCGIDPIPDTSRYYLIVSTKYQNGLNVTSTIDKCSLVSEYLSTRKISKNQVLITMNSQEAMEKLLKTFNGTDCMEAVQYSLVRDPQPEPKANAFVWSAVLSTIAVTSWILCKIIRSKK